MKKSLVLVLIFASFYTSNILSQNKFDTLSINHVGKGVKHLSIQEPNKPWTLDVLQIDLAESNLKIETSISQNKMTGFERTSAMSQRNNINGHHVIGAINGGFFDGNGQDVGMQISEGEIVTQNNSRSTIGVTIDNIPFIERVALTSELLLSDKQTNKTINGINKTRETDYLILYN